MPPVPWGTLGDEIPPSVSSSSCSAPIIEHSRLHKLTPLWTIMRTHPRCVKINVVHGAERRALLYGAMSALVDLPGVTNPLEDDWWLGHWLLSLPLSRLSSVLVASLFMFCWFLEANSDFRATLAGLLSGILRWWASLGLRARYTCRYFWQVIPALL